MKRIATISLVLLAGLTLVAGAQGFGGHRSMMGTSVDAEQVTYSGRIRLAEGEFPRLVVGNEEYTLRINPALAAEVDVQNNATVEVTGVLREFRSFDMVSTERVLHVTVLEIGGTRYVSSAGFGGGPMHMHRDDIGTRRGMMDQRAPQNRRGGRR